MADAPSSRVSDPARGSSLKDLLASAWDVRAEFDFLLGTGPGTTRRCWNKEAHKSNDSTPALSFNPSTGAWKCHACGEKGDLFTLYDRVKKSPFAMTLRDLLHKYKVWNEYNARMEPQITVTEEFPLRPGQVAPIRDTLIIEQWRDWAARTLLDAEKMNFLRVRYGLSREIVDKYMLAHAFRPGNSRMWTPIWSDRTGLTPTRRAQPVRNFVQHDYMRASCGWQRAGDPTTYRSQRPDELTLAHIRDQQLLGWEPIWNKDGPKKQNGKYGGKCLSVAGHGTPYLYPFDALYETPSLYLVGGEYKALLLLSLGIPACTFTGGEGKYSHYLLGAFLGKRVRVLMDPDSAGVHAAELLSQELADTGAVVERGDWPEELTRELPPKGDVTDLLRLCDWNPEALEHLAWKTIPRTVADVTEDGLPMARRPVAQDIPWETLPRKTFGELDDPRSVGKMMKWKGLISGRGEAPFLLPSVVRFDCPFGATHEMPMCGKCRLPTSGYRGKVETTTEDQMTWIGTPKSVIDYDIRKAAGIPKGCQHPKVETDFVAAEQVLLTPPVDFESAELSFLEAGQQAATRLVYVVQPERIQIRDNAVYEFGGLSLPGPKTAALITASTQYHGVKDDVFHWTRDEAMHRELRDYYADHPRRARDRLVADVREHIARVYGEDGMLESIILSFFLPFRFRLDEEQNKRVCPAVLVLGDTNVAKSGVTKSLIELFGAGRFKTMDSKPTMAGLIGGNLALSRGSIFRWGVFPSCNGAFLGLDEVNKLPVEELGAFTNMISSGTAQRTTVAGEMTTQANVRILLLGNPRGQRPLRALDGAQAVTDLMGTVQDLGRLEYWHIQPEPPKEVLLQKRPDLGPGPFLPAMARYQLSWAWGHQDRKIIFTDKNHFYSQTMATVEEWSHTTMFLTAMAKWKLGRISAGFAAMTYSTKDGEEILVTPDHVEMAREFLYARYSPWIKPASEYAAFPPEITRVLDRTSPFRGLRTLASMAKWTRDDAKNHLPTSEANELILLWTRAGCLTQSYSYYSFTDSRYADLLITYVADRTRREAALAEEGIQ